MPLALQGTTTPPGTFLNWSAVFSPSSVLSLVITVEDATGQHNMKHEISPCSPMKEQRHVKGYDHPKVVPWHVAVAAAGISPVCAVVAWTVLAVAAS
eukprot:10059767-Ditylum_brightwellii.AAC.1